MNINESIPEGAEELRAAYHEYIGKYGKNRAVTAMATDYGCVPATIRYRLHHAGIRAIREMPPRPGKEHLEARYRAAVAECGPRGATGMLANEFGVTYVTVRQWMLDYRMRASEPAISRKLITDPCPCGAVATTRYRGEEPALCFRCYMRAWAGSSDSKFRRRSREFVVASKEGKPCMDCGGYFPACCLQWDHVPERGQKLFELGRGDYSVARMKAEMAKCDLVCANCHVIRTWNRKHPEAPLSLKPIPGAAETAVAAEGALF